MLKTWGLGPSGFYLGRRIEDWQRHLLRCDNVFLRATSHGGQSPSGLQHRVRAVGLGRYARWLNGHALRFHELGDLCLSCGRVPRSGKKG